MDRSPSPDADTLWKIMYSGYGTRLCKEQFFEIIDHCQKKNIHNKIGGYIVFNEKTLEIHQYLEGPRTNLLQTYERIKRDPRINYITFFASGRCEKRFTRTCGLTPWMHRDGVSVDARNVSFYQLSTDEFHKIYEEVEQPTDLSTPEITIEEELKEVEEATVETMVDATRRLWVTTAGHTDSGFSSSESYEEEKGPERQPAREPEFSASNYNFGKAGREEYKAPEGLPARRRPSITIEPKNITTEITIEEEWKEVEAATKQFGQLQVAPPQRLRPRDGHDVDMM